MENIQTILHEVHYQVKYIYTEREKQKRERINER